MTEFINDALAELESDDMCEWTLIDVTYWPGCNPGKTVWPREQIENEWTYCPFCGLIIGW